MDSPQRILLIRLKSMGDIVFTLPAVHAIRSAMPQADITFLISKEYAPLLKGFREVNSMLELDRERFRGLHPLKIAKDVLFMVQQMRSRQLNLTIDFQGYGETALLAWASGAQERWGTVYRPGRSWAYTRAVPRHLDAHPADDYLMLLQRQRLPNTRVRNEFVVPEESRAEAAEFFIKCGLNPEKPTLFVQPFTSAAEKNWPLDRYLEVARDWQRRKWQILFGGGPADRPALEAVHQKGYAVAAGVPLLVSAGLAAASSLVLGADTGLVHLAVAMGKRVIMIMRSAFAGGTHPFQHPEWAVTPANKGSVSSIPSQVVIDSCAQACAAMGLPI